MRKIPRSLVTTTDFPALSKRSQRINLDRIKIWTRSQQTLLTVIHFSVIILALYMTIGTFLLYYLEHTEVSKIRNLFPIKKLWLFYCAYCAVKLNSAVCTVKQWKDALKRIFPTKSTRVVGVNGWLIGAKERCYSFFPETSWILTV